MASELQDIPEGGLPPAAKTASENAVKSALSESVKDGEGDAADETPSNGLVTVLHNPSEFNVVHPLHSTWTLWFDNASKQDKAKDWNEQLQQVMEIDSVEEFWGSAIRLLRAALNAQTLQQHRSALAHRRQLELLPLQEGDQASLGGPGERSGAPRRR